MLQPDKVIILDFGSQYTQLIARRVREAGVYSEIHPCTVTAAQIKAMTPKAVILSGGPSSVTDADAPPFDPAVFDLGLPMLCICYGMQLLAHFQPGGTVAAATDREYGRAELSLLADVPLFAGLSEKTGHTVWMSHGIADERVPFTQSLELYTALSRLGVTTTLAVYPRSGHDVTEPGLIRDLMVRNLDWFTRFVPVSPAHQATGNDAAATTAVSAAARLPARTAGAASSPMTRRMQQHEQDTP